MVTCGIDWAQDHHDIAIVDAEGRLVAKRRIPESVAGFAELTAMLADAGDDPKDPIPVAIETPRGLLVGVLRATGRPIYPINPMSVARYRERTSMSGKKSDHADAVTLANILRRRGFPAEFEGDGPQQPTARRPDFATRVRRAGEGDFVHVAVRYQVRAGLTPAGHDIQHPRGQLGLDRRVRESVSVQSGFGCGLKDDGAAGGQSRSQFHRR